MNKIYSTDNRDSKKRILLRLFWLLPGPVFYALFRLAEHIPGFSERVYSRSIYRAVGQALSTVFGFLPFSLGELLLYAAVLFGIVFIIVMIVHAVKAKKTWWIVLLRRVITLMIIISMVYAVFIGVWGFNYTRQKLADTLELDDSPATVDELRAACEALINRANTLRSQVSEDDNGIFLSDISRHDIMCSTADAYNTAAEASGCALLGGSFGRVKPVLWSRGLSETHISGVYFPFTGEANVNADVPDLYFAATCLHEAAHQRGFAREDEANFLGYYIASFSDNVSVQYSGTMLALVHAMNKLYSADKDQYFELRETYCDGINRDLAHDSAYWLQFESPASDVAETVNNTYLKANLQQDGVKSYGRMVDLLIALWRSGAL